MSTEKQLFTNNAATTLLADIDEEELTFEVQTGYGTLFPYPNTPLEFFLITFESITNPLKKEIVKIKSRVGDVFTIAPDGRGYENTTKYSWSHNDTLVDHRLTAGSMSKLRDDIQTSANLVTNQKSNIQQAESKDVSFVDITGQNKTCKWIVTINTHDDRTRRQNGGTCISSINKWFHSDQPSRIQQIGLVMMGQSMPSGIMWKTMDGGFVEMSPTLALQIFNGAAALDMTAFAVAEYHKSQMLSSENPITYNFKTGWPAIYGE